MNMQHPNGSDIANAGFHSMRAGADFNPEVAADLGFTTPDNFAAQVEAGRAVGELTKTEAVAKKIGGFMCGDCLIEVEPGKYCPGGHVEVTRTGVVKIHGN